MTEGDFPRAWRALRKHVSGLKAPWLDELKRRRRTPYEILVSCILSLRTRDETTKGSSERLFALARTPGAMAALREKSIERAIYPAGFYRVKARAIKALSREIEGKWGGRVPDTLEGLLSLKGVGRKTANLVLSAGFGKPAICVDTHVHRIPNRWGLVRTRTPRETELALEKALPRRYWREINPTLVPFGQHVCQPVSPWCSACPIAEYCGRVGVKRSR
ncbi:MAG: endonuclease III [Thermodesulfovibrionales bacterium]